MGFDSSWYDPSAKVQQPLSLADSSVLTSSVAVQNGADVMCPGLTSPGADMADAEAGDVVVRMCFACNF